MDSKSRDLPYFEFGNYLKACRMPAYRSAKALCDAANFSFSYGLYASYERGEELPPAAAVEEFAAFLKLDPYEPLMHWVAGQVKSAELKKRLLTQKASDQPGERNASQAYEAEPYRISSNSIPKEYLDQTWLFGGTDRKLFEQDLWLFKFLVRLHMTHPEPLPIDSLGFADRASFDAFARTYLARWVEDDKLVIRDGKIGLALPYFHAPKTKEWEEFRRKLLGDTFREISPQLNEDDLKGGRVHRTRFTKILTREQRDLAVQKLAALEREIFSLPFARDSDQKDCYGVVLLLGRSDIELPDVVRKPKKTRDFGSF